jgi:hypothetical protein
MTLNLEIVQNIFHINKLNMRLMISPRTTIRRRGQKFNLFMTFSIMFDVNYHTIHRFQQVYKEYSSLQK